MRKPTPRCGVMTESPSQSGTVLDSILVGVREELAAREALTPLEEVKAAACPAAC